jgi:hypothetical protein
VKPLANSSAGSSTGVGCGRRRARPAAGGEPAEGDSAVQLHLVGPGMAVRQVHVAVECERLMGCGHWLSYLTIDKQDELPVHRTL